MNLYVIIVAILAALGLAGVSGWKGYHLGQDSVIAAQAKEAVVIQKVQAAAALGAAQEISKIEVKHTTVRQQLETEIREKPIYRDCVVSERVLGFVNQAITGSEPVDPGGLPAALPDEREQSR